MLKSLFTSGLFRDRGTRSRNKPLVWTTDTYRVVAKTIDASTLAPTTRWYLRAGVVVILTVIVIVTSSYLVMLIVIGIVIVIEIVTRSST